MIALLLALATLFTPSKCLYENTLTKIALISSRKERKTLKISRAFHNRFSHENLTYTSQHDDMLENLRHQKLKHAQETNNWVKEMIEENTEETPVLLDSMTISELVSIANIFTPTHPAGYQVIMDTGSSHAVLPLAISKSNLSTFKPLNSIDFERENFKLFDGIQVDCPTIFKTGYKCSVESYVSDASNSVAGIEEVSFSPTDFKFRKIKLSYQLNKLRGSNEEIGTFGLTFGAQKFLTNPLLQSFYNEKGPQNIIFRPRSKLSKEKDSLLSSGSITFNEEVQEDEFIWLPFIKQGLNYSLNAFYGVFVSLGDKEGIHHITDMELNKLKSEDPNLANLNFPSNYLMFDSGTNGLMMDPQNTMNILSGMKKIYGESFIYEQSGDSVYFCWPYHGKIKNSEVIFNIIVDGFILRSSLEGVGLFLLEHNKTYYECSYIVVVMDEAPVLIYGFPYWEKFIMNWDARNDRLGIKEGNRK